MCTEQEAFWEGAAEHLVEISASYAKTKSIQRMICYNPVNIKWREGSVELQHTPVFVIAVVKLRGECHLLHRLTCDTPSTLWASGRAMGCGPSLLGFWLDPHLLEPLCPLCCLEKACGPNRRKLRKASQARRPERIFF